MDRPFRRAVRCTATVGPIVLTVLALNLVGEGLNDGLNTRSDGRGK